MELTGMRVDRRIRWRHARRLKRREKEIRREVLAIPMVLAALAGKVGPLKTELAARVVVQEAADQAVARWERAALRIRLQRQAGVKIVTLKAIGKRPPVRVVKGIPDLQKKIRGLEDFNPGSNVQKGWLLYEVFGLPVQYNEDKRSKKKAVTTDAKALVRLARHQIALGTPDVARAIGLMKEYEHVNQLRTTFIEAKLEGGRLFTQYHLHRTATGRVSSGGDQDEKAGEAATNIQNWPKELRDIIIPEEGNLLVQVDWSKVEWLLTLMFAGDEEGWRRAIAGEDQHRRLAAAIFGRGYEDVSEAERTHAKRGTHGINYGMGPQKLADVMGISFAAAKRVLGAFKDAFPKVAEWREEVVKQATKQHYLDTPFGWRRWFWRADPPEMIAFLPSATGADMLKARLPQAREVAMKMGGRLLTSTHDSVLAEVWHEHAVPLGMALKEVFERPFRILGRGFPAEPKNGMNWRLAS